MNLSFLFEKRGLKAGKLEMAQIYDHLVPEYMAGEIARLSFAGPVASERSA